MFWHHTIFITILWIIPHALCAQTYVMPVHEQSITVDGQANDWHAIQKYSVEYHQDGPLSSRQDLQAQVALAISDHSLFILTCLHDDQALIQSNLKSLDYDQIMLLLQVKRKLIELKLTLNPNQPQAKWLKVKNINKRSIRWQIESTTHSQSQTEHQHCVEWQLDLQYLPQVYGQEVKFAALFFDADWVEPAVPTDSENTQLKQQDISVYSSHFVRKFRKKGFVPKNKFVLGGNLVWKRLYENTKNRSLNSIKHISAQWVGDRHKEEIYLTQDELIVLGKNLSCSERYCEWVHGWKPDSKVLAMELKDYGSEQKLLHVIHKEPIRNHPQGIQWVHILEIYTLSTAGIQKLFAHVIQIDTAQQSFSNKWKILSRGRVISITPAFSDQLTDELDLSDIVNIYDVHPLLIQDQTMPKAVRYELNSIPR